MGGITPRERNIDDNITQLKRQTTIWHEHDHAGSSAFNKKVRAHRVAGVNSARLGYINTHAGHRATSIDDRPHWMSEQEDLPGGFYFTPSDPDCLLPVGT